MRVHRLRRQCAGRGEAPHAASAVAPRPSVGFPLSSRRLAERSWPVTIPAASLLLGEARPLPNAGKEPLSMFRRNRTLGMQTSGLSSAVRTPKPRLRIWMLTADGAGFGLHASTTVFLNCF